MTGNPNDHLVEQWLAAVQRAGADLPPDRLGELLADLREHIDIARGELSPETAAEVRTILERLGDPGMIIAEARHGGGPPSPLPGGGSPATGPPAQPGRGRGRIWLVVALAAVALLCVAGCVVGTAGLLVWNTGPSVQIERPQPIPEQPEFPTRSPTG